MLSFFDPYWRIVIRPNLFNVILLGVFSFLAALAEVAILSLIIPIVALFSRVDSLSSQKFIPFLGSIVRSLGLPESSFNMLYVALAGVFACSILKSALVFWLTYAAAYMSKNTSRTLSLQMFAAYIRAKCSAIFRLRRGEIINDIQEPPDSISHVIYYLGLSVASVGQLMLALCFLAWLSPVLTLAVAVIGLVMVYAYRKYMHRQMIVVGKDAYGFSQASAALLVDAIDGVRVIKAHGFEDRISSRFEKVLVGNMKNAVQLLLYQQAPKIWLELVGIVVVLGLVLLAQVMPSLGVDFPAMAAFVVALRQITPAASTLSTNILNMAEKWRQIQVIDDVLARLPLEEESRQGQEPVPGEIHTLALESVSFAYPEHRERDTIQDLSLTFTRGTVTALVGGTGAGKTTVADLILCFQRPCSGRITVNGIDIRQFALADWRAQIGYVGQDVFLFNATVAENIAALDDHITQTDIVRAAKLAQVHDYVMTLPNGYATLVGDKGAKLSGGQRQRIAVARAVLRKPKILIFDEATSALDNLTEQALHKAINTIRRHAIVIVIAHRLSTVEDTDEILVLQDGRIVECGSHAVLLARRGAYWRLYSASPEAASTIEGVVPIPEERI